MKTFMKHFLISFAITIILVLCLQSCYHNSKYIDINKEFGATFKKTENGISYFGNIINRVHEIEYYKNTPIEIRLSSAPYRLCFYIESDKIKDVKLEELFIECDGISYFIDLDFESKYFEKRVKDKRISFDFSKIILPHIKGKKLNINYKVKIILKNGEIINKEVKMDFEPTYKIESGFKFIEMMMSA
ncbi:hypothetical protein AAEX28_01590 [Lentisphaerota bacterium WC36G]|nr:hypothetical protein LJT99_04475 [Lentisphaerae bacterium WC36]